MINANSKIRVLYVVREFPQLSQTYVKNELKALGDEYEVAILSMKPADRPYKNHLPFTALESADQAVEFGQEFKPDVIHGHYFFGVELVAEIAQRLGVPYTIRSHSFDVLPLRPRGLKPRIKKLVGRPDALHGSADRIRRALPLLNDDQCLGVLGFPFQRPWLIREGVAEGKIIDCFPVVDVESFRDRSPNGDAIMNTGVVTPKKQMDDFIELAASMPGRQFNLYPVGYHSERLEDVNKAHGSPVHFSELLEPEEMPPEYKKHQWLVYTANFDMATVGWPMAIAEAQAAGVGVCMANIRPDLKQYIGDAGFLFDTIDEARKIISQPVPEDIREAGFVQAEKSNINNHISLLTDLWPTNRVEAIAA
mgnify:CR=1 FL=1|jgi:glycosyltransferase involved in cell wall biosynthesis|tara:strand:- start:68565 stop:69659 length:1095 start_codon:yes stop_codon:yes gene_type:complete